MSRFWNSLVHQLAPYTPGEQIDLPALIKLNANENPYGPSPKALRAMSDALSDNLRLYPDAGSTALKDAIARRHGLLRGQIFVGNSSDEVLAHTFHALLKQPLPLLLPDISYAFYPTYCRLYSVEHRLVPLNCRYEIDVTDYRQPCGAIILANPNGPTGCALPLDEIETLLLDHPDQLVVIDEAYVDFGCDSAVTLLNQYDNLLVIQTFSKSRALAGLRVGFAMGHPDLIAGLERVKMSFNCYPVGQIALAGAVAAFEDDAYFAWTCNAIIASRTRLSEQLAAMGFYVLPSKANFIFLRHPLHDGARLAMALRDKGVLVRHFNRARIDQFLRISIGTDAQCDRLLSAMAQLVR